MSDINKAALKGFLLGLAVYLLLTLIEIYAGVFRWNQVLMGLLSFCVTFLVVKIFFFKRMIRLIDKIRNNE